MDERSVYGDGVVEAGLADVGVVEEIVGAGLESVGIEQPAFKGNLQAELMFFVALAVERVKVVLLPLAKVMMGPDAVTSGGG